MKRRKEKKTITKRLTKIIIITWVPDGEGFAHCMTHLEFSFFGQQMQGTIYARAEIGSMATNPAQTKKMADQCFCVK